jgi:N-methylhydantoinase B
VRRLPAARIGRCTAFARTGAPYFAQSGGRGRLITGTGGGWGDPLKRPRDLVLADLRAELITEDVARRVYGLTEKELARVRGVSATGGRAC